MRLSVDRDDPGYSEAHRHGINVCWVRIWLDGKEVDGVITADEETNLIVRYKRTSDGLRFIRSPDSQSLITEELRGSVRIELLRDCNGEWPHAVNPSSFGDYP